MAGGAATKTEVDVDRWYLPRWFFGTLLGICAAGGCFACLIGRIFQSDSTGWLWFSESLQCFATGAGYSLICGVPGCVLGSLLLHAAGGKTESDRLAWAVLCGGGTGAASLLLSGLPAAIIVASVVGAVGAFAGNCLLDTIVHAHSSKNRLNAK